MIRASEDAALPTLDAAALAARGAHAWRRLLLFGDRGTGKSTLAADLARRLTTRGLSVACISADPGTPAFGPPGVVALARWDRDGWRLTEMQALCTLDAGRFRLPLVQAASRLAQRVQADCLLVDAAGVTRGVPGAELLEGLVGACGPDTIAVLARDDAGAPPLLDALRSSGCALVWVRAAAAARRPDALARARARTTAWDEYLAGGATEWVAIDALRLLGTPPPVADAAAWRGRQVALCAHERLVALGEVVRIEGTWLELRLGAAAGGADTLVVRDVARRDDGLLTTLPPPLPSRPTEVVGESVRGTRRPIRFDAGAFAVTVLNGVCGDPVVVLRPRGVRRVLLLDLGEATALSRRVMHRVTDVFVSHAHFDHVAGFLWLLRARMGTEVPACRVFGPPGMHAHVEGMLASVRWDRIGDAGPEFEVGELDGERIVWKRIKAGAATLDAGTETVEGGVLLDEPGLRVSAIELDHGIPVLSFAVESGGERRIRKDRLAASGLPPGPWLGALKRALVRGETTTSISLPDGRSATVAELADAWVESSARVRLVYATDLADTPDNRARLVAHARGAQAFVCEAPFVEADAGQAARTQHLTARACGEIAAAARVERLIPFHFSKRYERNPDVVYAEIRAASAGVVVHTSLP